MIPLEEVEAVLKDGSTVGIEDAMELIRKNAHDGDLLRRAASNGYINVVIFFIHAKDRLKLTNEEKEKCTNRGAANEFGMTPLHFASFHGYTDIVECLVSSGSLQELKSTHKITPLYCASHKGHLDVVKLLISYKVFSLRQCIDAMKIAACKGEFEIAKYLCAAGIPAEEAMYYAAREGHEEIVKLFLHNGVHPDASEGEEWVFEGTNIKSLHYNVRTFRETHTFRELFGAELSGDLTTEKTPQRRDEMALHSASVDDIFTLSQLLLEATTLNTRIGYTPLDIAVESGHGDVAAILQSYGGVLNKIGHFQKKAVEKGRFLSMICLQALGADLHFFERAEPSVKKKLVLAPIHVASERNHRFILQYLLQRNVLVDARDNEGNSALHYACLKGHSKIVHALVKYGASVNSKNKEGECPLALALLSERSERTDIMQYLLENDALPSIRCNWSRYARPFSRRCIVMKDSTPLHCAAFIENISAAKLLIDFGADVNAISPNGKTPLHLVDSVGFARLLLKNNADPMLQDKRGLTPLLCAKKDQRRGIVSLLKRHILARK